MAAQRIATNVIVEDSNAAVHQAIKEMLLDYSRPIKPTVQRAVWVCEVCGMIYLTQEPDSCDCCGVTDRLVQQQDTRQEIGKHW